MVVHLSVEKQNSWGGFTTYSLCRRTNRNSKEPMNLGSENEVTCKFCLKKMAEKIKEQEMVSGAEILEADPRKVVAKLMHRMTTEDFITTLQLIAWNCNIDAQRLKTEWTNPNTGEPDPQAGIVWDTTQKGLLEVADNLQSCWDAL